MLIIQQIVNEVQQANCFLTCDISKEEPIRHCDKMCGNTIRTMAPYCIDGRMTL